MRTVKTRALDSTFDLNLAPILDIIVSIVPLLLLSVAFVQVKMIDTSVPQVAAEAAQRANDKSETTVTLKVAKKGFVFEVTKDGKSVPVNVANKGKDWDLDALNAAAFTVKALHPEVFRVDMAPEQDVSLDDLVKVMDNLRKAPEGKKTSFTDPTSGQKVETELMFPNVLFANVIGE
jgi:biopolymer transport protein ExbD